MQRYTIYKLVNTVTQEAYYGCTRFYRKRVSTHLHNLKRNSHCNLDMQQAYNQGHPFYIEIICKTASRKKALLLESALIMDYYCYNIRGKRRSKFIVDIYYKEIMNENSFCKILRRYEKKKRR